MVLKAKYKIVEVLSKHKDGNGYSALQDLKKMAKETNDLI